MEAPRNYQALYGYVLCPSRFWLFQSLSFPLCVSLLYSVYLALSAITEMSHAAFVGGYFVVG